MLRTAVSLSATLGKSVRITNIREGRQRPGLLPEHLAAIRAVSAICNASLDGAEPGCTEITFHPGDVGEGQYRFDIATEGSSVLLLQTVLPALMLDDGDSEVTVIGGTHNPLAPCFEYLRDVFGLLGSAMNLQAYFEMLRAGFHPRGGGEIRMKIRGLRGAENLAPLRLMKRGSLKYIEGVSAVSASMPSHLADQQCRQVLGRLAASGYGASIEQASWDSRSPGNVVFIRAVFSQTAAGFFALGSRERSAEQVADDAVDQLLEFIGSPGTVDSHAADQLLPLAALCPQESRFVTERVTDHLVTNANVVSRITGRDVLIDGQAGEPATVTIREV